MTSNPANTEPVNFLVGRKIRQEEYILEHHQVRYCAYAQRLATPMEHFFTGGDEKEVNRYLKKQQKEAQAPINNAFAEAFSKIKL